MKEVTVPPGQGLAEWASFAACLATVLEFPLDALPRPAPDEDPALGGTTSRWLGGLGLGIVSIPRPRSFSWPGPWIARVRRPGTTERRCVVMFGVPSGVVWDPAGEDEVKNDWIEHGFLVAAADIALARPAQPTAPVGTGAVEGIFVSPSAGQRT